MKETKFLVKQFYRSTEEQERKAKFQSILNRYLTARLIQSPPPVRPGAEDAAHALREE